MSLISSEQQCLRMNSKNDFVNVFMSILEISLFQFSIPFISEQSLAGMNVNNVCRKEKNVYLFSSGQTICGLWNTNERKLLHLTLTYTLEFYNQPQKLELEFTVWFWWKHEDISAHNGKSLNTHTVTNKLVT